MYKQKGTGNARAGSRRSGIRRGGGHIHAIRPRDWSYRLPKKALRIATYMAVASRIADNEVVLIDQMSFTHPKTKEMAGILKALKIDGKSVLVAMPGYDMNVYKSGRNIEGVQVLPISELNALNVLHSRRLLMTTAALDAFKSKAIAAGAKKAERLAQEEAEKAGVKAGTVKADPVKSDADK
jgi:large subunit ribosomal protein L4